MGRKYTKMEILAEEVFRRKEAGETNRQIAESYGLTKYQIKQLVARQNRKKRAIANGYVPRPKGRPRKDFTAETEETKRNNELVKLRMENELLRNFLCEIGRR
jgi:predicted transcriptional regulator